MVFERSYHYCITFNLTPWRFPAFQPIGLFLLFFLPSRALDFLPDSTMAKFIVALVSLLAASASAFTAPQQHAVRSSSLMMTTETGARDPIKVGVIGCGRIGIVHLGAINKAPGVVPVVVSNPTVSKAEDGKVMLYQSCIQRKYCSYHMIL